MSKIVKEGTATVARDYMIREEDGLYFWVDMRSNDFSEDMYETAEEAERDYIDYIKS